MGLNCVENETFEEYKLKVEAITDQLMTGKRRLVIWGAGENGERFKRYCDALHLPVQCFVDNNADLWGTERWGLLIVSPEELSRMEHTVVLISFPFRHVVLEVAAQIEGLRKAIPYFDDNLFYLLQNTACGRTETVAEITTSMYKFVNDNEYLYMPILSPKIITTRCNLKCRDCILRIPYLKEHKDEPLESVWRDMDRVLEIVDSIGVLEVCGGETFLHKELVPFLDRAKSYSRIFNICVITNGTIVPDDDVFDAMQYSNVVLKISDYGEMSHKKVALEAKCREKGIPCFIQSCSWFDLSPKMDLKYTKKELQTLFDSCNTKDCCIRNWDGVIYRCGFQRVWGDAGLIDDVDLIKKDSVDLNDRADDKALKQKLREYLSTSVPFEICRYCRGNTMPVPRAIQLKSRLAHGV